MPNELRNRNEKWKKRARSERNVIASFPYYISYKNQVISRDVSLSPTSKTVWAFHQLDLKVIQSHESGGRSKNWPGTFGPLKNMDSWNCWSLIFLMSPQGGRGAYSERFFEKIPCPRSHSSWNHRGLMLQEECDHGNLRVPPPKATFTPNK